ncbi:MAG: hypothetical protein AB8G99_15335 [Planctomycetaceae bacterium]
MEEEPERPPKNARLVQQLLVRLLFTVATRFSLVPSLPSRAIIDLKYTGERQPEHTLKRLGFFLSFATR